ADDAAGRESVSAALRKAGHQHPRCGNAGLLQKGPACRSVTVNGRIRILRLIHSRCSSYPATVNHSGWKVTLAPLFTASFALIATTAACKPSNGPDFGFLPCRIAVTNCSRAW